MDHTAEHLKVIDKIRKLLALSASPNEAEASAAAAKAHELLRAYNLSLEDIGTDDKSQVIWENHLRMSKIANWRISLGSQVARSNYSRALVATRRGCQVLIFVGRKHNTATAGVLFDYLDAVVMRLGRQLKDRRYSKEKFRDGLVDGLSRRLAEMSRQEVEESTALVVLDKEVDESLKGKKIGTIDTSVDLDTKSYTLGYQAAKNVSLHKQVGAVHA